MKASRLLVFLCLLAACWASCHHQCNHHGECVDNECVCEELWVGSDCSIPFLPLHNNDTVQATVSGDWMFFYTELDDDASSMRYSLTDTLLGDCDLYVRYNDFPSRQHFDASDHGWGSESHVQINQPANGIWIAGVYNFLACSFTLELTIENLGVCPNDCSGHGTCNIENECLCDPLWAGEDCSKEIEALSEELKNDQVGKWQWRYYYHDVPEPEEDAAAESFQILVSELTEGDTDLYVSYGQIPQMWDYDYRNAMAVEEYALSVGNPVPGRYFIGIYGFNTPEENSPCLYNIQLDIANGTECEDRCSSHGYCNNGACSCTGPFEGDNCETMTEDLKEGESVAGYAANNQWNFYTATANSATNMVVSIEQDWNDGGDCDLYIRADENPTRQHFDYRNIGFEKSFELVVQNPLATKWHIGVYGFRHCQYFISQRLNAATCPNDCSGHGSCVSGRCNCKAGFAGQDCASPLARIHSKDVVDGSVGQNKWVYYKFTAPNSHTSIAVELMEATTEGYLALYVLEGAPPELTGAQYSDTAQKRLHNVYFLYDGTADSDHDFYIGVRGTALVPLGSPVDFQLFVYSPPL